jgi:predicted DNA-binding transcriptional regulator AlpA
MAKLCTVISLADLPPLLTAEQVLSLLQTTRRSLDRWVQLDAFPKPIRLGAGRGALRWRRSAVEDHLRKLEASHTAWHRSAVKDDHCA